MGYLKTKRLEILIRDHITWSEMEVRINWHQFTFLTSPTPAMNQKVIEVVRNLSLILFFLIL